MNLLKYPNAVRVELKRTQLPIISDKYAAFEHLREKVSRESNSTNIEPYNPVMFKKDEVERLTLKQAKKNAKKVNGVERNEILKAIIDSKTPNWGSIKIKV